jgi:hypothetical protein
VVGITADRLSPPNGVRSSPCAPISKRHRLNRDRERQIRHQKSEARKAGIIREKKSAHRPAESAAATVKIMEMAEIVDGQKQFRVLARNINGGWDTSKVLTATEAEKYLHGLTQIRPAAEKARATAERADAPAAPEPIAVTQHNFPQP